MNNEKFFRVLFESIPDCRKVVLIIFLFQNDKYLLREIGFSERDINRLKLEFKFILIEQHEEYLDFVKNEEESVIDRFYSIINGSILRYDF